jgi:hypothetical protein
MPEKDKKELFGGTSGIHSSDAFIQEQLRALEADNYGLNSQIIEVTGGDLLSPLPINTPGDSEKSTGDPCDSSVDASSRITYKHSAFGAKIQELRNNKKQSKKAA